MAEEKKPEADDKEEAEKARKRKLRRKRLNLLLAGYAALQEP